MTGWHAPPESLAAYVEGRLDAIESASLERHVQRCAECRSQLAPVVDGDLLEDAWDGVRAGIEQPRLPWLMRQAGRLGLPEPTQILLAAAASLRAAWLSGVIVALGFAALAAAAVDDVLWPFLLVAPLVPVLGVAVSYGDRDDPFEALSVTAPYGRTRLIVSRTLAVLVTTVPAACLVGLTLPGPTWVAAAWLGPALAMLTLQLALSGYVGSRVAVSLVVLVWGGIVLGSTRHLPATWPVEAAQQLVYAGVAAMALAGLLARSVTTKRIGSAL